MAIRFLPIGIQDFEDLRNRGAVYVDKTHLVYKLATEGKPYFLSRPRRFGKSLLLSTLEAYFLGKKDLFKGLAIEKLEKDWIQYPVIKISFGANSYATHDKLLNVLDDMLNDLEAKFGFSKKSEDSAIRLKNLIQSANKKTGKQVVILIDEYDKPILDALYTQYEEQNRQELRSFYSPLKDCDQYIRFLFITGITKVSLGNGFSGLNQLNDISMNKSFSSICGISQTELEECFKPEIEALSQKLGMTIETTEEKLNQMYGGYHFTHNVEELYNPFSLLNIFNSKRYESYWLKREFCETKLDKQTEGLRRTPSLLVKTLQNQPIELTNIVNGRFANENQFKNYDPDSKNMLPVIYQSGYLTIKDFEKETRLYKLDFPNREVEEGFLDVLLKKFITVPYDDIGLEINNLRVALRDRNLDRALNIIKASIADLPTVVKKDMCENYYESVTHLMFRMTGWRVVSELQNVCGRSDVVVASKDSVFIFELKMDKGRPFEDVAEEALAQIDANGYSQRFAVSGKKMYKVALVFSSDGKGLLGWKVKE
ncbi:MAG: AAA family ATPase [Treponema sp.]|nr:AAA family ATPase [Treponema sp.]